jgi:acetoin utilization protein AcuB
MLVKNWMSRPVITVDQNASMQDATGLLREHGIKMLPVMDNDKLVGIVTDRDLKRASASDATSLEIHELLYLLSKISVKEIMTKNPITFLPDSTICEAAGILLENKISGAPVTDEKGQLVGVITKDDLFKILVTLTGVDRRGIQFAFQVVDRPNSIFELTGIIRKYGGRVVSILTAYHDALEGYRYVYIRAYKIDRGKLAELEAELKEKAILLYTVDHRMTAKNIHYYH